MNVSRRRARPPSAAQGARAGGAKVRSNELARSASRRCSSGAHDREDFARDARRDRRDARPRRRKTPISSCFPRRRSRATCSATLELTTRQSRARSSRLRDIARETRTVIVAGVALRDGRAAAQRRRRHRRRRFDRGTRRQDLPLALRSARGSSRATESHRSTRRSARSACSSAPTAAFRRSRAHWSTAARKCSSCRRPGSRADAIRTRSRTCRPTLLARVRARENGVPFVAANKCGIERGMVAYCGKSQIVDADGDVLAIARTARAADAERRPSRSDGRERPRAAAPPVAEVTSARRRRRASRSRPMRFPPTRTAPRTSSAATSPSAARWTLPARRSIDLPCAARRRRRRVRSRRSRRLPARRIRRGRHGRSHAAPRVDRTARARARARAAHVRHRFRPAPRRRAFAVDPDGAVIAGTFDGYRLASFALDPRRTAETTVAPGTDVADGLERVAAIVEHEKAASQP